MQGFPKPPAVVSAAVLSAPEPLPGDLAAIAALSTTEYGRALLALADASSGRSALGLAAVAHTVELYLWYAHKQSIYGRR